MSEKAPRQKARARGFLKSFGMKGDSGLVVTDLVLTDGYGREAAFTGLNARYPKGMTIGDELSVSYRPLSDGLFTMKVVESVRRVKPRKGRNPNGRK